MRGINAWKMEKEEEETSEAFAPLPPRKVFEDQREDINIQDTQRAVNPFRRKFQRRAVERANVREVTRHQRCRRRPRPRPSAACPSLRRIYYSH